jgi:hypothetical protein
MHKFTSHVIVQKIHCTTQYEPFLVVHISDMATVQTFVIISDNREAVGAEKQK